MNNRLEITTVQSSAIRILFESLKDVLTDVNIHANSQGIKIMSMDGSKSAIVHVKLLASQFEKFECSTPIVMGVNMLSLFKILKSIKNNDVISFLVTEDTTKLIIKIQNKEKQKTILCKFMPSFFLCVLTSVGQNVGHLKNISECSDF